MMALHLIGMAGVVLLLFCILTDGSLILGLWALGMIVTALIGLGVDGDVRR